jgi:hypothetical protein
MIDFHLRMSPPLSLCHLFRCLCSDGSILIADSNNHAIRRLSADLRTLSTVAGCGESKTVINGPSLQASFRFPASLTERMDGSVVVADQVQYWRVMSS